MTLEEKQEIFGIFYAHDLMLNVLLKDYVNRNADTGKDTEHLEAFVRDLQMSFEAQRIKMSPYASRAAETKVKALLGASLGKYWA